MVKPNPEDCEWACRRCGFALEKYARNTVKRHMWRDHKDPTYQFTDRMLRALGDPTISVFFNKEEDRGTGE